MSSRVPPPRVPRPPAPACAEDLIFDAMPFELSELTANSPLYNFAFSPRRFARGATGPPPLASIPSGEPVNEMPATSMPGLERQSTPQAIHAS